MSQTVTINPFDRLGLTLFFAVALHVALILGVGFDIWRGKPRIAERTLEVLVVQNPRAPKEPEEADFLAQASQEGGGEQTEVVKPKTEPTPELPPEPVKRETPDIAPANAPVDLPAPKPTPAAKPKPAAPPPAPKKVLTSEKSEAKTAPPTEAPPEPKPEPQKLDISQLLASTNREIARLSASIDKKTETYAKRPRRKQISASTKEYIYANYLEAWRRKVERIGNLNYPDEARRNKLYGSLMLLVSVRPDGSVENIQLMRSSGHKLLDDAAIRIVELAAPFAPFPAEIRKETDILEIVRTWQFLSDNRLVGGN